MTGPGFQLTDEARPAARSAWGKVIEDAKALGFIGNFDVPSTDA